MKLEDYDGNKYEMHYSVEELENENKKGHMNMNKIKKEIEQSFSFTFLFLIKTFLFHNSHLGFYAQSGMWYCP